MAGATNDLSLGIPDPAAVRGSESDIRRAFREACFLLDRRISLFLCLPFEALDNLALKRELDDIGKSVSAVAQDR
jgi:arsenate reductase (thioredoxin)